MRMVWLFLAAAPILASAQSQFSLQGATAGREAPASLIGVWGNARQCAAYRAGTDNHPLRYPYHISARWIRQGPTHCYLSWQDARQRSGQLEAIALAQCGEDDLRDYRLVLHRQGDRLRIRWSLDYVTPALRACR